MLNTSNQSNIKWEKKIEISIKSLILLRQLDDGYAKKKKRKEKNNNPTALRIVPENNIYRRFSVHIEE